MEKIAIVDIESTGSSKGGLDAIIEIGIVLVDEGKMVNTFQTLINPERPIDPFVQRLTGITPQMVEKAPSFDSVSVKIYELLKDRIFVAHNVSFDIGVLKREFAQRALFFDPDRLCTVALSKVFYPSGKSHSLKKLCEQLEIPLANHHRALADATATWELLKHWVSVHGWMTVLSKRVAGMGSQKIESQIPLDEIKKLYGSSGVLTLYDSNQRVLYTQCGYDLMEVWKKIVQTRMSRGKGISEVARVGQISCPSKLLSQFIVEQFFLEGTPLWMRPKKSVPMTFPFPELLVKEVWGQKTCYIKIKQGRLDMLGRRLNSGAPQKIEEEINLPKWTKKGDLTKLLKSYLQRNRCEIVQNG